MPRRHPAVGSPALPFTPQTLATLPRLAADWVFGYGSLIWNPEFDYVERHRVTVYGYHRAFCIGSVQYRGTPESPGVVLGLDRGGSCQGVAFRLHAGEQAAVIEALYRREMVNGVYEPRILHLQLPDGRPAAALTFVARRDHPSYQRLSHDVLLQRLSSCSGRRGPNRDYAINTWQALREWGIRDASLAAIVRDLDSAPPCP